MDVLTGLLLFVAGLGIGLLISRRGSRIGPRSSRRGSGGGLARAGLLELQSMMEPEKKIEVLQQKEDRKVDEASGEPPVCQFPRTKLPGVPIPKR